MKTTIAIPQFVAHEILIFGIIFINSWALSIFSASAGIFISALSLLAIIYIARACIGAYRYLSDRQFTFSTARVYPPLFTTSILFLGSSYLFYYFPTMNHFIGIPIAFPRFMTVLFIIGISWFFIHRQKIIIAGSAQSRS